MVRLTHGESSLGEEVAADQEVETAANESTKVQNPRQRYAHTLALCIYCACVYECRVGLRLYLACFTPVAPVASL